MTAAAVVVLSIPPRKLDRIALLEIRKWLTLARQDTLNAALHARGNPEAREAIVGAGQAVRAALDKFELACLRGGL